MSAVNTSLSIRTAKGQGKLVMLTAYDYPSAVFADRADVDILLVGDSLGMVILGQKDTLGVTMDMMVYHCRAVSGACTKALVVGDMPFLSYEDGISLALRHAGRLMTEGGVRAVKLEGGMTVVPQVEALVNAGIPVMGHVGLTPQRVATLGGFRLQGNTAAAAQALLEDAKALEEAGCFALVLECVPEEVGQYITSSLSIPTIGIGAGKYCDGQVLVFHDVLGLNVGKTPKFVRQYASLGEEITRAVRAYAADVRQGTFPQTAQTFHLDKDEVATLLPKPSTINTFLAD